MDTELVQLARAAVAALQGQGPSWVEIAQLLVSGVGLACIVGGLFSMRTAGQRRDREIDMLAENLRESTRVVGQALDRQGEAMTQAFTQQGEALRQQGEALRQQGAALATIGQALDRQGEAMTQAFTQQGRALEILIERTAPR